MYLVHGLTRSYFTRKMTGYLDYTDRPWRLAPMGPEPAGHPAAAAAGWTGAIQRGKIIASTLRIVRTVSR